MRCQFRRDAFDWHVFSLLRRLRFRDSIGMILSVRGVCLSFGGGRRLGVEMAFEKLTDHLHHIGTTQTVPGALDDVQLGLDAGFLEGFVQQLALV